MQAVSMAVQSSLDALCSRLLPATAETALPLLETGISLSVPHMVVSPRLQEILQCLDTVVAEVKLCISQESGSNFSLESICDAHLAK